MAKFKKVCLVLLVIPVLVCCMGILVACGGGNSDSGKVNFQVKIQNSKGQVVFHGDHYEWSSEIKKGSTDASDLAGPTICVKTGYAVSGLVITAAEANAGGKGQSLDYTISYSDSANGTRIEVTDPLNFVNYLPNTSCVEINYNFPDTKHDYVVTVDASACQGYGMNVTLNVDTPILVAKTNQSYDPFNTNYYKIDNIIETPHALNANHQVYGNYGDKLLIFAQKRIGLSVVRDGIPNDELLNTSAYQLSYLNSDYIYRIKDEPYFVYQITYGSNGIRDLTYQEYRSTGKNYDLPDLLAVRVVNHVENTQHGNDKMTGYYTQPIVTGSSVEHYYQDSALPQNYYAIPTQNCTGEEDFYFVYRHANGSKVSEQKNITEHENFNGLQNNLAISSTANLDRDKYFDAMSNTTLLIDVPAAYRDHIKFYFEYVDGRTFAGSNQKTFAVPTSSYTWKTITHYQDNVSVDSAEYCCFDLSTSNLSFLFGEIPSGTINLVMDVDDTITKTIIDVENIYDVETHSHSLEIVNNQGKIVQEAVMYAEGNYLDLQAAVAKTVANGHRLRITAPENQSTRPFYQSVVATVRKANGDLINVTPSLEHDADNSCCYIVFNVADTQTILAENQVKIEFTLKEKITSVLNLTDLTVPDALVGKLEYAPFNRSTGKCGNFTTLGRTHSFNLARNNLSSSSVLFYTPIFNEDGSWANEYISTSDIKLMMTYDDSSVEGGRKTVEIAYLTQVTDVFSVVVAENSSLCYWRLYNVDNYDRYANRVFSIAYDYIPKD